MSVLCWSTRHHRHQPGPADSSGGKFCLTANCVAGTVPCTRDIPPTHKLQRATCFFWCRCCCCCCCCSSCPLTIHTPNRCLLHAIQQGARRARTAPPGSPFEASDSVTCAPRSNPNSPRGGGGGQQQQQNLDRLEKLKVRLPSAVLSLCV